MAQNKLTATQVKNARHEGRDFKMADGGGLTFFVRESGRYWWFRYRFGGKERTLSLGTYPEVSLADARRQRDKARELLERGIDPVAQRRAERDATSQAVANTFEMIAREWWETIHQHEVVYSHAERNLSRLRRYAFPPLGERPIQAITAPEILDALRRIEAQGHLETAHRVRTLCSQVFRYAIQTGRMDRDPTQDLRGALRSPRKKHHPALVDPKEIGPLLRAIDSYSGEPQTRAALQLSALLFMRPGELRKAEWWRIDLEQQTWDHQPSKRGDPLLIPLPRQAAELLRELHRVTSYSRYVFPSRRSPGRPISNNTVTAALRRLDYGDYMVAHGFRAMARTLIEERLGWPTQIIEMQLGHRVRDVHGRAYNRTQWLEQRGVMLQQWADYLDTLRTASLPEPEAG